MGKNGRRETAVGGQPIVPANKRNSKIVHGSYTVRGIIQCITSPDMLMLTILKLYF